MRAQPKLRAIPGALAAAALLVAAGCAHAPVRSGADARRDRRDVVFVTGSRIARPPGGEAVSTSPLRVYTLSDLGGMGVVPDLGAALRRRDPAVQ